MKKRNFAVVATALLATFRIVLQAHGQCATTPARVTASKTATIEWQPQTLRLVQEGGHYGRLHRLRNGDLLCVYASDGVLVRRSRDDGKTWQKPVEVARWPYGNLANAELLTLRDGTVLCFMNQRPRPLSSDKVGDTPHPFAIVVSRSRDNGQSWGASRTLYNADIISANGCWEPTAVQLPSGEVQLFFANENPYCSSDEQEITLLRSFDSARTWSAPQTASFRAGSRDGMPVPLVLRKGRGIVVAIEDNGLSGTFKPVIISTSMTDSWRSGAVDGKSAHRWSALQTPLAPQVYAGAPYLRQMPSGQTILAFQQSDDGDIDHARVVVGVGDGWARNFAGASFPFPQQSGTRQLWPALFVKNKRTLTVLCETRINGHFGVWSIDGELKTGN